MKCWHCTNQPWYTKSLFLVSLCMLLAEFVEKTLKNHKPVCPPWCLFFAKWNFLRRRSCSTTYDLLCTLRPGYFIDHTWTAVMNMIRPSIDGHGTFRPLSLLDNRSTFIRCICVQFATSFYACDYLDWLSENMGFFLKFQRGYAMFHKLALISIHSLFRITFLPFQYIFLAMKERP